jgi:hypothetical protein
VGFCGFVVFCVIEDVLSCSGTLDITTTIALLTSRGQSFRPLLLFYCQIVGDYDRVLSHYVSEGLYGDAITVLQNSPIEKVNDILHPIVA